MAFRDLSEVLEPPDPKVLPINGVPVEFPRSISAKVGAMCVTLVNSMEAAQGMSVDEFLGSLGWSDEDADELERGLLGDDGLAKLNDLGVLGEARMRVIATLLFWHLAGQEAAEVVWEGKAPAQPNREQRRAAGRARTTAGGGAPRTGAAAGGKSSRPKRTPTATAPTGSGSPSTGS
jgi:hypothetical protein